MSADLSKHSFLYEGRPTEDTLSGSLYGAVKFVNKVQETLDDIKDNTKRVFWWSFVLIVICLGLFILAALVRLRHSLDRIVQYQELFRIMWDEDKRLEEERQEEQRENREKIRIEENRRRVRAAMQGAGGGGGSFSSSSRPGRATGREPPSPFGSDLDHALDSAPPRGPERDEWIRRLASMAQGIRRQQGQYRQAEDDDDDED